MPVNETHVAVARELLANDLAASDLPRSRELAARIDALIVARIAEPSPPAPPEPIPMVLHCPECRTRHIDEGEFATKVHHTHSCQGCGLTWRPAVVPTVGVQFLPGFKNAAAGPGGSSGVVTDSPECAARSGHPEPEKPGAGGATSHREIYRDAFLARSEAGDDPYISECEQAGYDALFESGIRAGVSAERERQKASGENDAERIEGLWALIPKDLPWCDECKGSGGVAAPCSKCRGVGRLPVHHSEPTPAGAARNASGSLRAEAERIVQEWIDACDLGAITEYEACDLEERILAVLVAIGEQVDTKIFIGGDIPKCSHYGDLRSHYECTYCGERMSHAGSVTVGGPSLAQSGAENEKGGKR